MEDTCVVCGDYLPEGRMICQMCEYREPMELVKIMNKKTDTFTIPGELPNLNEIIGESKIHWSNYSSLKKANTLAVAHCARQKIKRKYNKINLEIIWFCKDRRQDKDNIMAGTKFILDGLVSAGIIKNDGWAQVGRISHDWQVDKHNPRIEVTITEVG